VNGARSTLSPSTDVAIIGGNISVAAHICVTTAARAARVRSCPKTALAILTSKLNDDGMRILTKIDARRRDRARMVVLTCVKLNQTEDRY